MTIFRVYFLAIIQTACTIPGIYPSSVSKIFIQKCFPIPSCKNTPNGGMNIANMIRIKSITFFLYSVTDRYWLKTAFVQRMIIKYKLAAVRSGPAGFGRGNSVIGQGCSSDCVKKIIDI